MAVLTHDIALRRFFEYRGLRSTPGLRDIEGLRLGVAMVELHGDRWESPRAIEAGSIPQCEQEIALRQSASVHVPAALRPEHRAFGDTPSRPLRPQSGGAYGMAIRADDVAFLDFDQQTVASHEHRARRRHVEPFLARVAMVEVHLMRFEAAAAVLAGHPPQLAKEFEGRALARHDPLDLFRAIPLVVLDVVGALTGSIRHGPNMNNRSSRVNRTSALDDAPGDRSTAVLTRLAAQLEVHEMRERLGEREPLLMR